MRYYEPENKAQSRQWVGPGSPRQKELKTQPSAGKVMAKLFWDAKGFIILDFLPKRSTVTTERSCAVYVICQDDTTSRQISN